MTTHSRVLKEDHKTSSKAATNRCHIYMAFSGAASQHNGRFECGKSASTPYSVDIESVVLATVTSTGKYSSCQSNQQSTDTACL